MTRYRLQWTRLETKETGLFPDVYRSLRTARTWAREWTQHLLNLDPERKSEIVVRVLLQSRIDNVWGRAGGASSLEAHPRRRKAAARV